MKVKLITRSDSNKLYVEYYQNDKRYVKSTKLDDTKKNRLFCEREVLPVVQRDILNNNKVSLFEKSKNDTMFYYLDQLYSRTLKNRKYATQKSYYFAIKKFKSFFINDIKVVDFDLSEYQRYVDYLSDVLKPKSVQNYSAVVGSALSLAVKDRLIDFNFVRYVEKPNIVKNDIDVFSSLEISNIFKSLENENSFLKNYFYFSFYTGLRCSEIIALKWSDINLDKKFIHIQRAVYNGVFDLPKNNKKWYIPISEPLYNHILKENKENEYIFNKQNGESIVNTSYVNYMIKKFFEKNNIKYKSSHKVRHTFVTIMLELGYSPTEIIQFTGHYSIKMIESVYSHYNPLKIDMTKYSNLIQFRDS